jgi:hypothetical protein
VALSNEQMGICPFILIEHKQGWSPKHVQIFIKAADNIKKMLMPDHYDTLLKP